MAEKTVPVQPVPCANVSLHDLVSGLVQSLLPLTIRRHNLVLNEISRDLRVGADENMLAYVLWRLINGAIQSTQNVCIHIEAITVGDRLMILIKDVGTYFIILFPVNTGKCSMLPKSWEEHQYRKW